MSASPAPRSRRDRTGVRAIATVQVAADRHGPFRRPRPRRCPLRQGRHPWMGPQRHEHARRGADPGWPGRTAPATRRCRAAPNGRGPSRRDGSVWTAYARQMALPTDPGEADRATRRASCVLGRLPRRSPPPIPRARPADHARLGLGTATLDRALRLTAGSAQGFGPAGQRGQRVASRREGGTAVGGHLQRSCARPGVHARPRQFWPRLAAPGMRYGTGRQGRHQAARAGQRPWKAPSFMLPARLQTWRAAATPPVDRRGRRPASPSASRP